MKALDDIFVRGAPEPMPSAPYPMIPGTEPDVWLPNNPLPPNGATYFGPGYTRGATVYGPVDDLDQWMKNNPDLVHGQSTGVVERGPSPQPWTEPGRQGPADQGGSTPRALDDIFSKGGRGLTVIVIGGHPGMGGDEDEPEIGTPYSYRDAISPDGRGDDRMPLDAPSDCSSFIANLIAHLTGNRVKLPAFTDAMVPETEPVDPDEARPGDLLFSNYPNQDTPGHRIDWGHVAMLLAKHGDTPDQWESLEQSTAPGDLTGQPGVDIRRADHAIDQGGTMIVRRPVLNNLYDHR